MLTSLQEKLSASQYLTGLQNKLEPYESYESSNQLDAETLEKTLELICDEIIHYDFDSSDSQRFQQDEQFLIHQKQRFALCWSVCELTRAHSQVELGCWQSRFAECTINFALKVAWRHIASKHKAVEKGLHQSNGIMPGLFLFGMGKLGGQDLNFSSDVDLIAYFDPEVLPFPDALGKSYICHQVLQTLTKLLGQNGHHDFIWRVDWRLRPNASASTLAMSVDAARDYYFYRASPWHRLALMKARVVAGDSQTGNEFLESLAAFIWRQNLDFRALDELAEIKQRINLEHPTLRAERKWREPIIDQIAGFNVKLGTGGIREIEFIANALQLVWGGKQYALRTSNTLGALKALAGQRHLTPALVDRLCFAYQRLRCTENAIQMLGNQQTHLVPAEPQQQENLLKLLGEKSWSGFVENLNQCRRIVSSEFETLFADQTAEQSDLITWPANLSDAATEIVTVWEEGFHQYGVSNNVRYRLVPLARALSNYLAGIDLSDPNAVDVSATVLRLHDFFRLLPKGEQYFRLLAESPKLLASIVPPLLYSPPMSALLKQSPHIIDCFMQRSWPHSTEGFDAGYVLQSDDYEVQLERLRRFVNETLYQLYLQFLNGEIRAEAFQFTLSDLAEHTLNIALEVVNRNMGLAESPITILGMGKVALRRMSPTSDLDLIFIFDANKTSIDLASRYVSRLQTVISTPMREGIVYELDTRLRPSGRSGAPTVSLESFASYQLNNAHTWEHIALSPSRVVAGNMDLLNAIDDVKREVLFRHRDRPQFLYDIAMMWQRVEQQRIQSQPMDVMFSKLRQGGLMQTEYLAACKVLEYHHSTRGVNFESLLENASKGLIHKNISERIQFWRIQQIWERLLGKTKKPLSGLRAQYLEVLLSQSGVLSITQLIEKKQEYSCQTKVELSTMLKEVSYEGLDEWLETNVDWRV